jgi:hypothetical protein
MKVLYDGHRERRYNADTQKLTTTTTRSRNLPRSPTRNDEVSTSGPSFGPGISGTVPSKVTTTSLLRGLSPTEFAAVTAYK